MPTFGLTDNDGVDVGNKYVTKEYLINNYPNLLPTLTAPGAWVIGANSYGGLGDNSVVTRSSPVTIAGGGMWKNITLTPRTSGGVKTDGTLWTWGTDSDGSLGTNSTATVRSSPGTTSGGGTDWVDVVTTFSGAMALKSNGTIWGWGTNGTGEIGDGTTASKSSPVSIVGGFTDWILVIRGNQNTSHGLRSNGLLYAWGANGGNFGNGTTVNRSSPVTVAGSSTTTPWTKVTSNGTSFFALKANGTLWGWGSNSNGDLGDGTFTDRSSPVTTAGGGTNWKDVSATTFCGFGIKTDGTLWSWGFSQNGEGGTGIGLAVNTSPVTIAGGGTTWAKLGRVGTTNFSAMSAIKTDGTLWSWGDNSSGQLLDGTTTNRSSPILATVLSSKSWKSVTCSFNDNMVYIIESDEW